MGNQIFFKNQKPKTCVCKKMSIDLMVGGETNEIQKYRDGNDDRSIKTDTSSS